MGKNQEKFMFVKAMSRPFEVREGEKLQEDAKLHSMGVQQLVEPRKCMRETQSAQSLYVKRLKQWR